MPEPISHPDLHTGSQTHLGEAIAVKDNRMHQLSKRQGLQHPAPKPPRPVPLAPVLDPPDQSITLADIPPELERPEHGVYGNRDTQLLRGVYTQGETRQRSTDGRGVGRCERGGCSGVALSEGLDLGVEEVAAEPGQEAE